MPKYELGIHIHIYIMRISLEKCKPIKIRDLSLNRDPDLSSFCSMYNVEGGTNINKYRNLYF